MNQSIYTQISKKIGLEGKAEYPDRKTALRLYREITLEQSVEAFEEVFKLYRFAPAAETEEDHEVQQLIVDAYREGEKLFRN